MDVLVRYGEIFLKGNNRYYFENMLLGNIQRQIPAAIITKHNTRLVVTLTDEQLHRLGTIFGIVSYSPTHRCSCDYTVVTTYLQTLQQQLPKQARFRVSCARLQKRWESSMEIERNIGAFIVDTFGWTVDLETYDYNIGVEIIDACYVYTTTYVGSGGLPVGVSGNVAIAVTTERDIVAALLMMKRGCRVFALRQTPLLEKLAVYSPFPQEIILQTNISFERHAIRALLHSGTIIDVTHLLKNRELKKELPVLMPLVGFSEDSFHSLYERYTLSTARNITA